MPNICVISRGPEETQTLGRVIGEQAKAGDIILLSGPLGAGKTCLAQGIAQGMGVKEGTASPSYVLMREYQGRLPLYHMDLYRLDFAEIGELGLDDYLYGRGVCVIEWADKGAKLMPAEHLSLRLSYAGEQAREIEISSFGRYYDNLEGKTFETWRTVKGAGK
jgi:tRNA threonylcarbamoyladenosine biosynthesis protein TsaE